MTLGDSPKEEMVSGTGWTDPCSGRTAEAEKIFIDEISKVQDILAQKSEGGLRGRSLHRKSDGCVRADFTIDANLPADLCQTFLSRGVAYRAVIRFSNGSGQVHDDGEKDARGMAIRVTTNENKRELLSGRSGNFQDFLLTNGPTDHARSPQQFLQVALAMTKLPSQRQLQAPLGKVHNALDVMKMLADIAQEIKEPGEVLRIIKALGATRHPVKSLATESFWSRTPFAVGSVAVKWSVVPVHSGPTIESDGSPEFLRHDLISRLADSDLVYELRASD